ncbi:hypothetical protein [Flavilitoribacter nigricans]|uniref:Uncharacterized protein n=1 Tax=Flavilitoribacter nigricans (strain ATCC 23147 / DSM 23189 / NBRC 102662 / NCIMB 1420 / SS-2) TaxID=1122177 RepID=A0A2D0N2G1_FLAN2|nr:hypothetical protein [Flavilitoribacter nigricans]PHN02694.1 hypothetical protein CRP01_30385 [Flavilitoribacter nigricans DSM 23189 = NBRC 102662]
MQSDIKLDGVYLVLEGDYLKFRGHDLMLDRQARRGPENPSGPRRALVHDHNDGLTINYGSDYPGGVTVNNGKIINPILEGRIRATDTFKAESGLDVKGGMTVKGSAGFDGRITAKDIRLYDLGLETSSTGGSSGGPLSGINLPGRLNPSRPTSIAPRSLVEVIKEMAEKIKDLEREVQRLRNA